MTREIPYVLMDPTGNRTILAEGDVPEARQPAAASRLMELEPSAEQVGFLSRSGGLALRMAGGEFCGNAAMCAAVLHGIRSGLDQGRVSVAVSGAEEPVTVEFSALPGGLWRGQVDMPRPRAVRTVRFSEAGALPVVEFRGISHVILEREMEKAQAETQEIDPEELNRTAGGWCWGSYDCYTAYHHDTPDEEGTDCFKDHDCAVAFKHPKCTYVQLLE